MVSGSECEKGIFETRRILTWISIEIGFNDVDWILLAFVNTAMKFLIS